MPNVIRNSGENMPIKIEHLYHTYQAKTPTPTRAIIDINLNIDTPSFIAFVGETGSGKSTLIQHLNALLIPTSGDVYVDEYHLVSKKRKNKNIMKLRKHVGLVFQFPEYQLFETTVLKDVMVGPKNFKIKDEQAKQIAINALNQVGIGEKYFERSPFDLSGGEKRRVAIAGILALEPDILVLDEPTAGLDPKGKKEILSLLVNLYNQGKTIIIVTHDMDIVMEYASKVIALHEGKVIFEGTPSELFSHLNDDMALEIPVLYQLINRLNERGFNLDTSAIKNVDDLVEAIKKHKGKENE